MADAAPGHGEFFSGPLEFDEGIFKSQLRRLEGGGKSINMLLRPHEGLANVGLDRLGDEF